MTLGWTALPWDSDFFGIPIGRVDLDGATEGDLVQVEREARAAGIVCLYGSLDPAEAQLSLRVQHLGWRFVEAAVMSSLKPQMPPLPKPPGMVFRPGTPADLEQMGDVIARLAEWSRFALDPRFGADAALRLQHAGIERAANDQTGEHSLVVAEDHTGIVAFITRRRHPEPVIDTIGTTARGSGAAQHLIEVTRPWAGTGKPLLGGPIATRNVIATRFVTNAGYRVTWVRYLYHRWLDEPVAR